MTIEINVPVTKEFCHLQTNFYNKEIKGFCQK